MKKIVTRCYNELVIFDDVTNTVEEQYTIGYGIRLYKMKDDGEIITKDEVIPYTKDSYLLFVERGSESKWVVIDDKSTIFDIDNVVSYFEERERAARKCDEGCNKICCDCEPAY